MTKKTCSQYPVVFSQPAIDLLYQWFPDSNGNLNVHEILDTLTNHYGSRGLDTYPDVPAGSPADEILRKVENTINYHETFSPVLSEKSLSAAQLSKAYGIKFDYQVQWEDAEGNLLTGILREVRQEDDGNGHYAILLNSKGGVDNVSMSLITHTREPGNKTWKPFQ
jgi:hypothetical protein